MERRTVRHINSRSLSGPYSVRSDRIRGGTIRYPDAPYAGSRKTKMALPARLVVWYGERAWKVGRSGMPVPTHNPLCQTRIYATACWDCQYDIFVLQCTCGSVVLLDDRYPPWPKHICASTKGAGGIGGSGLSGWTAVEALRAQGVPITPDVIQEVFPGERHSGRQPRSEPAIKKIEPGEHPTKRSVLAVVRELPSNTRRISSVDKRPELGLKLLGLDPKIRYRQITLVDNSVRPNESFTALIPNTLAQGLKVGVIVSAAMSGRVSGDSATWIVNDVTLL